MKKNYLLSLLFVLASGFLTSFAQLDFDEVSFRNDLKNTVVHEINRARQHYGKKPVVLADMYSQDSDEAVAVLYSRFSSIETIAQSDFNDVQNDIDYKDAFPSGGRGYGSTVLFFYSERHIVREFRENLRRTEGSILTDPDVRWVSVSIIEDQFGQIYVAIMSYY